jgi:hypothetical protein
MTRLDTATRIRLGTQGARRVYAGPNMDWEFQPWLDPAVGFVSTVQPADDPAGQVDLTADPAAAATYWRQSGPNVDVGRNPSGVPYPGGLRSLQYTATRRARLVFPGVSGNNVSLPDSTSLHITDDIEMVARVAPTTWTPTAQVSMISRYVTARTYTFQISNLGRLVFRFSVDAGASDSVAQSTVSVPFAAGQIGWVKVTRVRSTGAVMFFTAPDSSAEPTAWTQLGTTINGPTAAINAAAQARLAIGSHGNLTAELFAGRIARAIVRNAVAGTAVVDVSENNAGGMTGTTFPATSGQTVTVAQTAGNTIVQPQPDTLAWRFDAADYPGTGLTYTDPRSRTWTLSAAGAITAP